MSPPTADRPWYREPMLALVIGLPASAVVAGLMTLAIAITHDDGAGDARTPITQDLQCVDTGNSKLPPDCR